MSFDVSYYSANGGREYNDDFVMACEQNNNILALVADGVGSISGGGNAAKVAAKTVCMKLSGEQVSGLLLADAVNEANTAVRREQSVEQGACTTIAALWASEKYAVACHVGDTRIYQIRNDRIIFQSRDHSMAQLAVLVGEISQEDIRSYKDKNVLVRALGAEDSVKPELVNLQTERGDKFLLCTDGFWGLIREQNIINCALGAANAGEWLSAMRRYIEVNLTARSDNHSAMTIIMR